MRLLLITRHYPPAVSGGAKRPYLLATALRGLGVEVRVCAPSLPDGEPGWTVPHPNRDPSTGPATRPDRLRDFARELLLWPDPDIRWCWPAVDAVLADTWRPDWVLSTSPPESIHVAGERLARTLDARWVADFRDHWLQNPHRLERRRLHRRLGERIIAKRLLPKADLVLAVDPVVAEEIRQLGARAVVTLPHFMSDTRPAPAELPKDCLNVVHAGSVSLSDPLADINTLLCAFEAAWARNPVLRLHLVGRLADAERRLIARSSAAPAIEVWGTMPLDHALATMAAADALAFVASAKMHVPPSKITDYMMFDRPIVACGEGPWRADPRVPPDDPVEVMARLRRGDGRNVAVTPPTAAETAAKLLDLLRNGGAGQAKAKTPACGQR